MRVFYRIARKNGVRGLVMYTKSAYILTMQSLGGSRIHNVRALGPAVGRSRSGLPSLIPSQHRTRMMHGDIVLIRIWLSWFSIYRVLEFPSELKLKTITDPGRDLGTKEIWPKLRPAIGDFIRHVLKVPLYSLKCDLPTCFPLNKSTPAIVKGRHRVS